MLIQGGDTRKIQTCESGVHFERFADRTNSVIANIVVWLKQIIKLQAPKTRTRDEKILERLTKVRVVFVLSASPIARPPLAPRPLSKRFQNIKTQGAEWGRGGKEHTPKDEASERVVRF